MTDRGELLRPPVKDLSIDDRVDNLVAEFSTYNPIPQAVCIDHEEYPLPIAKDFQHKFPYIVVKAEIQGESGPQSVIMTTPKNPDDANMVFRLMRSDLIRREYAKLEDSDQTSAFCRSVRFLEVNDRRMQRNPAGREYVSSYMEKLVDTEPISDSVHLIKPGILTSQMIRDISLLLGSVQTLGQPYTRSEDFRHRHISDPFSDRQNNKWWMDIANEKRLGVYRQEFGDVFVTELHSLLESDETAGLFSWDAKRYCVFGNFIPIKMGIDADGNLVIRDIERTSYTQYRAFDYATFLVTLVSDPPQLGRFFEAALSVNHDKHFLQHLRRSVLLDRLGNIIDLVRDRDDVKKKGDTIQYEFLYKAVESFKRLADDALHQKGMWEPTQYGLL
jgi:hypothetical protein